MMYFILFLIITLIGLILLKMYQRRLDIWLPAYVKECFHTNHRAKARRKAKLTHIFFLFADHFELGHGGVDSKEMERRRDAWLSGYPAMVQKFRDADGRPPQHTWFYPPHYDVNYLKDISALCFEGFGEIEMHLHHENDTADSLRSRLEECKRLYQLYGALITAEKNPRQVYGFIHGMWALANSADGKYCGVNNELEVLNKTGCYADFTLPSGYKTQTRKINGIYYAFNDPVRPKSHDTGIDVEVGNFPKGDLLIVQGPLGINWKHRPFPRIENASITRMNPPTPDRIDYWVNCAIGVKGRPNCIFIKVHTHGAVPEDWISIFGDAAEKMHAYLGRRYNDGSQYRLHYVTAREVYNIIKAIEAGEEVNEPNLYRNYLIPPYANRRILISHPYQLQSYTRDALALQFDHHGVKHVRLHDFLLESCEGDFQYLSYHETQEINRILILVKGEGRATWVLRKKVGSMANQNTGFFSERSQDGYGIVSGVMKSGITHQIEISLNGGSTNA